MKRVSNTLRKQLFRLSLVVAVFALAIGTVAFVSHSASTTYWYVDGVRDNWFIQEDVYAFTTPDNSKYIGYIDNAVVANHDFQNGVNLVYFKSTASEWERDRQIRDIKHDSDFAHENPAVTRFTMAPYKEGLWYVAGEKVLVTFQQGKVDHATVDYINDKYNLNLINDPWEMPDGGIYSYIFQRNDAIYQTENIIELARNMYLQDSTLIANAEPDLMRIYDVNTSVETSETLEEVSGSDQFYMVNEHDTRLEAYYTVTSTSQSLQFIITDLFGRNMYVAELGQGGMADSHIVDIAHLSQGTYFGTIIAADGKVIASRKFQKL